MRILLLSLGILFASELEVQGNLKVTGDIDSPTIDALSGMKPERVYYYFRNSYENFSFTVPDNKIWVLTAFSMGNARIQINGSDTPTSNGAYGVLLIPGTTINDAYTDAIHFNIYEYPISGSGTEQGMDYIIP